MKDQRFNNKSVSSSIATKAHRLKGVKAEMIRKNNPEDVVRRIKEYLLYTRLRSLIPPAQASELRSRENGNEAATEMELERHEIPVERDSDEEEQEEGYSVVVIEQEEGSKPFVPSFKIKKMEGSLIISTIVHKDLALTSSLFKILEEEKQIDVVFENQYRTESKVAHTIQVKVGADYNVDLLEKKLCRWAGKPM